MKKYYSAICLIIRDENDYLQEWIRHHISIGFEHFYIYDHNCKVPIEYTVKTKLKSFEREYVTVIDWSGKHTHAQDECYQHCLANFKEEAEWITFIDIDEFIVLHKDKSIKYFLSKPTYENVGGIYMNWVMFNANGKEKREDKPVMERFTKQCPDFQQYGKLIVRADKVRRQLIHEARYYDRLNTVDEDGNLVIGKRHPYHIEQIQCNHYYTRSWEEWKNKISRGVADPIFGRNLRDFFLYNPDMKYLDTGIDYVQEYERNVK
jgi:hypothetical protein